MYISWVTQYEKIEDAIYYENKLIKNHKIKLMYTIAGKGIPSLVSTYLPLQSLIKFLLIIRSYIFGIQLG
jgi:hypothetical protein